MKLDCKELKILINAYIDDELPAEDRDLIEQHLKSCKKCSIEAESLFKTVNLIKKLDKIQAPAELSENLYRKIEQKHKATLINSLIPAQINNKYAVKILHAAALILCLLILFLYVNYKNNNISYITQMTPEEYYLSSKTLINNDQNNPKLEELINDQEQNSPKINNSNISNNEFNRISSTLPTENKTNFKSNGIKQGNKPINNKSYNTYLPNAAEIITNIQTHQNFADIAPIKELDNSPNYSNNLDNEIYAYNDKIEITVYAKISDSYKENVNARSLSKKSGKTTKNEYRNVDDLSTKSTFEKTKIIAIKKEIPETIIVPVNFVYNLNEPIMVMTRVYFNENKSIKKIEFLSNALDTRMKIILLKSLKNYNWKDYLIRYNLQGTSYEMDFIFANEGMTLWNIEERIL